MLVERSVELQRLQHLLAAARSGAGNTVIVDGPVGVGKSALLRALTDRAREHGFTCLSAAGARIEQTVPMGLLVQLFVNADLPDGRADQATRLLDDGVLAAMLDEREPAQGPMAVRACRDLTRLLLDLASPAPLLIGVDDVHFADPESLRCLLYLARRIDRAPIMLVLNGAGLHTGDQSTLAAELSAQPNVTGLRLAPLSPEGVAAVVADHEDLAGGAGSDLWHQLTGGNPLLLHALLEDCRTRRASSPPRGAGEVYTRTLLSCLYRSDETVLPVLRVLAVLGEPPSRALLSELGCGTPATVEQALASAGEAGILDGGRFRHPQAAAAVLDAMPPGERTALHERVAQLLYRSGAPATTVARHGLAARWTGALWAVPVLREAAEQAIAEDDTVLALDCLRLAEQNAGDTAERGAIHAALLEAKRRLDPTYADRHARLLIEPAYARHLAAPSLSRLLHHLMWFGHPAEAVDLLELVGGSPRAADPELAGVLHSAGSHLAFLYPGLAERTAAVRPVAGAQPSAPFDPGPQARVAAVTDAVRRAGITESSLLDAEAVLQKYRLDDHTCESLAVVLQILVIAEQLDAAAHWCGVLLGEAQDRNVPHWCAMFAAVRSAIEWRRGNLTEARRQATASLTLIRPRGLGVLIGVPLAVLLHVATCGGDDDEARRLLAMPVPPAVLQTPFGLEYLRAQGRFHLARGNRRAAVMDFETCRDLMARWDLDLPGLVPWRTDLAEARLDAPRPAKDLVVAQMGRLGPRNRRTKGISLRVLAATADLRERPALLRDAVKELQASGDQLELAVALTELSDAQHELGEYTKARTTNRRVQQVISQAGLEDHLQQWQPPEEETPDDSSLADLSDAERRVATLAAHGYTNQQISRKLFITVSTVEQHLTRVYRKLRITRRSDLPFQPPRRPGYLGLLPAARWESESAG